MVYIVVSIRVKEGKLQEFLELFKSILSTVRAEKGCIQYVPVTDMDAGLPPQTFDKNVVILLEKWESLEALHNHLATPHMAAYFEKEKAFVEGSIIKVLQEA